MDNNIGVIIWGCKGGHRILCSSNVDCQESSIANTTKDIRSFVRFNNVNLTTYAIEFTDKYKIFTIYRSSNDSGFGAYIAITVYVPHNMRIEGLRPILDTMMNAYFNEYVHPILGTYHAGKYDNIAPFLQILNTVVTKPDANMYSYKSSCQDDLICLRLYDSIDEVDAFFASPYRKEFFCCQEVMFMSRDMYNKQPETLTFNLFDENRIIKSVSEPDVLPKISVNRPDIVSLKINGVVCDKSISHPLNIATDTIDITICEKYCEDYIISGKVRDLLSNGSLRESNKTITIGNTGVPKYKDYTINFTLNGKICHDNIVFIEKDGQILHIKDSKVNINGAYLLSDWNIFLLPFGLSSNMVKIEPFIPAYYVDNNKIYDVKSNILSFKVRKENNVIDKHFIINVGTNSISIPIDNKKEVNDVIIYLPYSTASAIPSFRSEGNETNLVYDNKTNTLNISSKILRYTLEIPDCVRKKINKDNWDFRINNKSCKVTTFFSDSSCTITINAETDIKSGKLIINNKEYRFDVIDDKISPLMVCIYPDNENYYYKYTHNGKEAGASGVIFFPYKNDLQINVDGEYKLEKENSVFIYEISDKKQTSTPSKPNDGSQQEGAGTVQRKIIFNNCKGLYLQDKKIEKDEYSKKLEADKTDPIVISSRKKELCVVYRNIKTYQSRGEQISKNKKNGFEVEYKGNDIIVTYNKPKSKFVEFLSSKAGFMTIIGILSIISLAAVWYFLLYSPNDGNYVLKVEFNVTSAYDVEFKSLDIGKIDTTLIKVNDDELYILYNEDGYNSLEDKEIDIVFSDQTKKTQDLNEFIREINVNINPKKKYIGDSKEKKITVPIMDDVEKLKNEINKNKDNRDIYQPDIIQIIHNYLAVDEIIKHIYNTWKGKGNYSNSNDQKLREDIVGYCKNKQINIPKSGFLADLNKEYIDTAEKQREIAEHNKKLMKDAKEKKASLHNDACTRTIVDTVEKWWGGLNDNDKEYLKNNLKYDNNKYNLEEAIKAYNLFFKANNQKTIDNVKNNYLVYFSDEQKKVVNKYAENIELLKEFNNTINGVKCCTFSEIINEFINE